MPHIRDVLPPFIPIKMKSHTKCRVSKPDSFGYSPSHSVYHGPPKPAFLEVCMVYNLVCRWPKPCIFPWVKTGAHGIQVEDVFVGGWPNQGF